MNYFWIISHFQVLPPTRADSETTEHTSIESLDEEDINQDISDTLSTHCDDDLDLITKSTKQPLKTRPKSLKKNQQEQEYELLRGLSHSIAQRDIKRQKLDSPTNNTVGTFGRYVTETLSELEPKLRNLAQHHINEIIFQAQMGILDHFNQHATTEVLQPQPRFYQPFTEQQPLWLPPNRPSSGIAPHLNPQQNNWPASNNEPGGFDPNFKPQGNKWSSPNQQPVSFASYPNPQQNICPRSSTPVFNLEQNNLPALIQQPENRSHDNESLD